ncbi:MAG: UDP-N-acetylmuramate dehydrogenase [Eggerthellaceae bacterium]|nr:UDP-N-acetylmuramate dehydrogenase [Eggerthellaceae bacterium]
MRAGEPMSAHTTFQIGGPADLYCVPASVEDVQAVCAACRAYDVPLHVIGCGSNLLVSDVGLRGVVMELGPAFSQVRVEGACVFAQAGATNEAVSQAACAAGLAGYEFASGIPGTVGGAAIMNAGAYDGEFAQVAEEVTCLTPEGQVVTVSHDEACWSYRHSMMDECGYVVLSAKLRLTPDDSAAIQARVDDLTERRTSKQPLEMPSAGSTFKRPEGYFAGKLIQDSGLRGYRIGGAQVSEKHTGFVVNAGGATAADVQALIAHIQRTVREQFGVEMHPEVRMWGF